MEEYSWERLVAMLYEKVANDQETSTFKHKKGSSRIEEVLRA